MFCASDLDASYLAIIRRHFKFNMAKIELVNFCFVFLFCLNQVNSTLIYTGVLSPKSSHHLCSSLNPTSNGAPSLLLNSIQLIPFVLQITALVQILIISQSISVLLII